jgi:putative hydrolase of the HAD superfamily
MPKFISFDMDGTLINPEFTDWVWSHGIPTLYAEKFGISFDAAKAFVEGEYRKVGEGAIEWYDIKYWLRFFQLEMDWQVLMEQYVDKINVYPDVNYILGRLKNKFSLILTSNAGREFIGVE